MNAAGVWRQLQENLAQPLAQQASAAWTALTPEFLAILEVLLTHGNICLDKRCECLSGSNDSTVSSSSIQEIIQVLWSK